MTYDKSVQFLQCTVQKLSFSIVYLQAIYPPAGSFTQGWWTPLFQGGSMITVPKIYHSLLKIYKFAGIFSAVLHHP